MDDLTLVQWLHMVTPSEKLSEQLDSLFADSARLDKLERTAQRAKNGLGLGGKAGGRFYISSIRGEFWDALARGCGIREAIDDLKEARDAQHNREAKGADRQPVRGAGLVDPVRADSYAGPLDPGDDPKGPPETLG